MVGVSRDSQETDDRFRQSLDLPYALVGDPEGKITGAYKVNWPLIGVAKRVTYLIARNRKVRLAFHDEFKMDAHPAQACALAPEAGRA